MFARRSGRGADGRARPRCDSCEVSEVTRAFVQTVRGVDTSLITYANFIKLTSLSCAHRRVSPAMSATHTSNRDTGTAAPLPLNSGHIIKYSHLIFTYPHAYMFWAPSRPVAVPPYFMEPSSRYHKIYLAVSVKNSLLAYSRTYDSREPGLRRQRRGPVTEAPALKLGSRPSITAPIPTPSTVCVTEIWIARPVLMN